MDGLLGNAPRFGAGLVARWRTLIDAERDRIPLWLPVCMGVGVLGYYGLRFEPPLWAGVAVALPALAVTTTTIGWRRVMAAALAAGGIGMAAAQLATARAPPLEDAIPTHATWVTGEIHSVEPLPDGRRITIGAPTLDGGTHLTRTLRIRLRRNDSAMPRPGDTVRIRALIRPPAPPAYPGGWDLQRDAFYAGLGGSGFALGPAEITAAAGPGSARLVQWLREVVAARITGAIPGSAGTVAATLLTGFQASIPPADHDAFRASGLAHLLAVAGLHIAIVMGFAMLIARSMLALSEHASLFWPTKQIAAVAALTFGLGYALLTGLHLPIQRSFAMTCLFTLAVLARRRAVSVRGLAIAATTLMLIEPQEVPGVSFQMSFSAVLALISGYEALRPWLNSLQERSRTRRFALYVLALALTSALAGTASAPFGAYHFGRIQLYFVLANMMAVPLTALWVMPAGLISLPLMPFGLEWLALKPMGWGAELVLWVARTTAALPGATLNAPHIPAWGLAVLSFGIAWLGLWCTRWRLLGLAPIALGLASPAFFHPPDLLVSADARLIGVRTPAGVYLQQSNGGASFTRDAWLQFWSVADAAPIPAVGDAAAGAIVCEAKACVLQPRPEARAALLVRSAEHPSACGKVSVIVAAEPARGLCPHPWPQLVDRFTVWRYGATAIWLGPRHARIVTDRRDRGTRPWVPPLPTPRRPQQPGLPPLAPTDNGAD